MFERFTRDAHRVVNVAVEEASKRSDSRIGTEHLLLGVSATEALAPLGLEREALCRGLDRLDTNALEAVGIDPDLIEADRSGPESRGRKRHIPFTGAAKDTLKRALQEAIDLGHRHIGAEHIALALTTLPDQDRASRALRGMGLDPTQLRASLLEVLRRAS